MLHLNSLKLCNNSSKKLIIIHIILILYIKMQKKNYDEYRKANEIHCSILICSFYL